MSRAGGGIIGCTSAYYLTRHPSYDASRYRITLLECTRVAGGASGKAGGLLALWAYPSNIVPLSYRLHAELAEEHQGPERWGYRRVHCGQVAIKGRSELGAKISQPVNENEDSTSLREQNQAARQSARAAGTPEDLDWLVGENVTLYEKMGGPDTTAQVHPYLFTTSMASLAEAEGARIVQGRATKINDHANAVRSVSYTDTESSQEQTILADTVILAAGPWTRSIYPSAPISGLRAHSVTIRPSRPVSAFALFTEIALPTDVGHPTGRKRKAMKRASPEIYARPNNEVYACGEGDRLVPLPTSSDLVEVDQKRAQDIVDQVSSISDELRDGEVTARQACYLPEVTGPSGGPIIGKTAVSGLLMATGHSCWGIQNAPATGKLISELVFDGKVKSADIDSLSPSRYL